jgi:hypothetical protein
MYWASFFLTRRAAPKPLFLYGGTYGDTVQQRGLLVSSRFPPYPFSMHSAESLPKKGPFGKDLQGFSIIFFMLMFVRHTVRHK